MSHEKLFSTNFKNIVMKKFVITFLLIISILSLVNGQFTKIGAGLALSSGSNFSQATQNAGKTGFIGLSFKGIYKISLPFHISPSFTAFYPRVTNDPQNNDKTTISSMMFDLNGHYVFNSLDRFEFYGLAGAEILFIWRKDVYRGNAAAATYKEKDNAPGLNIGAGTYMKMSEIFDLCVEAKYVFSKYHQFMLNAGVLLNLDWMKKHENIDL
jgi:hypothetical protein